MWRMAKRHSQKVSCSIFDVPRRRTGSWLDLSSVRLFVYGRLDGHHDPRRTGLGTMSIDRRDQGRAALLGETSNQQSNIASIFGTLSGLRPWRCHDWLAAAQTRAVVGSRAGAAANGDDPGLSWAAKMLVVTKDGSCSSEGDSVARMPIDETFRC